MTTSQSESNHASIYMFFSLPTTKRTTGVNNIRSFSNLNVDFLSLAEEIRNFTTGSPLNLCV